MDPGFGLSPVTRLSPLRGSVAEADKMDGHRCRVCGVEGAPELLLGGCCSRCEKRLFDGCLEQVVSP